MGRSRESRSRCPIATSLDILGDRWSLVIIRDLLVGKRTFGELLASREAITTSVLTDRLGQLEAAGLIRRRAYQQRPERFEYGLTPAGRGLLPLLQDLCRWAERHLDDVMEPPMGFMSFSLDRPLPGEEQGAR